MVSLYSRSHLAWMGDSRSVEYQYTAFSTDLDVCYRFVSWDSKQAAMLAHTGIDL